MGEKGLSVPSTSTVLRQFSEDAESEIDSLNSKSPYYPQYIDISTNYSIKSLMLEALLFGGGRVPLVLSGGGRVPLVLSDGGRVPLVLSGRGEGTHGPVWLGGGYPLVLSGLEEGTPWSCLAWRGYPLVLSGVIPAGHVPRGIPPSPVLQTSYSGYKNGLNSQKPIWSRGPKRGGQSKSPHRLLHAILKGRCYEGRIEDSPKGRGAARLFKNCTKAIKFWSI